MKKNAQIKMMVAVFESDGEAATVTVMPDAGFRRAEVRQGDEILFVMSCSDRDGWARVIRSAFRRAVDLGVFRREKPGETGEPGEVTLG